jgi:hypothetical protein
MSDAELAILMQNCIPTFADVHPRMMFMTPESVADHYRR